MVNVGDEVMVKVLEIDDKGRLNLSRRDALIELDGLVPENTISDSPRRPQAPRRRAFPPQRRPPARQQRVYRQYQ